MARRAAIPELERRRAAEAIAARVLESPELAAARHVLVCLSFGDELDTRELIGSLLRSGRELFVPRVEKGKTALHVHPFPCRLETLSFGLEQPAPGEPALAPEAIDATLDLALVAGLGFDRRGYRLGYGAGYFDRFLVGRRFPALGLAFASQIVDRLPLEAHDVPLSAVLTEAERIDPGAGA